MSQDNTITLSVDPLNDGNPEDRVFTRWYPDTNRTIYNGPSHTLAVPEQMTLYRTLPKVTGNFLGTAKSACKFTFTVEVEDAEGNTTTKPLIFDVSVSAPVGTPAAKLTEGSMHVAAMCANNAVFGDLIGLLEI
jgi:hypothetical protein